MDPFNEAIGEVLRLLHGQERFESDVRDRLGRKGYDSDVIEQVLDHLKRKGVLSEDRAIASRVGRYQGRRAKGDAALAAELEVHGANSAGIQAALDHQPPELERAQIALMAKFRSPIDPARAARFLSSRGFSSETIETVLENLTGEGFG